MKNGANGIGAGVFLLSLLSVLAVGTFALMFCQLEQNPLKIIAGIFG